jgi:outer membrane lipoprotein carrier protein
MNCERLKIHLCLWGWLCFGCGWPLGANGLSAGTAAPFLPPDAGLETLLRGVENKYNHLKTLRLHFEQIYQQDRQVLREEGGTLYLRKPGQMRWEYESPEPKLFLSDGRRLMLYVPQERRVTETEIKQSDDLRSPMRFLLGGLRFEKEFERVERDRELAPLESRDTVIKAVPKQMADRLEWVVMEISPEHQIRRLILREPGGVQTEFRFGDETADLQLSPELFHFQAPAGTEVVRQ